MQRESFCGYHYISCFTSCHKKYFYKYVLKWVPEFVAPALNEGAAIHEGIANFYLTRDRDQAFIAAMDAITERKPMYADPFRWKDGYHRVALIVENWLNTYEYKTFDRYRVLQVEKSREILLTDSNYILTIRPDAELEDLQTGEIIVPDIKTSSYNLESIYSGYESSQQGTFYIWGLKQLPEYQDRIITTFPDAIYQRGGKVTCERKLSIYRSENEVRELAIETKSKLDDLTDRMTGYLNDPTPEARSYFFDRCPTCDGGQAWKCEYRDICRHEIAPEQVPLGYVKDDRPFPEIVAAGEAV